MVDIHYISFVLFDLPNQIAEPPVEANSLLCTSVDYMYQKAQRGLCLQLGKEKGERWGGWVAART